MKELEKILKIRENAQPEQVMVVDDAMKILGESFKTMIQNGGNKLKEQEEQVIPYNDIKEALAKLRAVAIEAGLDFPDVKTEEEIKVYVMKYGMEVVKGR